MDRKKIENMRQLSDKLQETNAQLTVNLEKISLLIDDEKVEEYVRLIEKNEELMTKLIQLKEEILNVDTPVETEKENLLSDIKVLGENLRKLNQINIDKLSEQVTEKTEENLMRSKKAHANRIYNDMQYDS